LKKDYGLSGLVMIIFCNLANLRPIEN